MLTLAEGKGASQQSPVQGSDTTPEPEEASVRWGTQPGSVLSLEPRV